MKAEVCEHHGVELKYCQKCVDCISGNMKLRALECMIALLLREEHDRLFALLRKVDSFSDEELWSHHQDEMEDMGGDFDSDLKALREFRGILKKCPICDRKVKGRNV